MGPYARSTLQYILLVMGSYVKSVVIYISQLMGPSAISSYLSKWVPHLERFSMTDLCVMEYLCGLCWPYSFTFQVSYYTLCNKSARALASHRLTLAQFTVSIVHPCTMPHGMLCTICVMSLMFIHVTVTHWILPPSSPSSDSTCIACR